LERTMLGGKAKGKARFKAGFDEKPGVTNKKLRKLQLIPKAHPKSSRGLLVA